MLEVGDPVYFPGRNQWWVDQPGVKAGKESHEVEGHCFFHTDGTLWPGSREWEGTVQHLAAPLCGLYVILLIYIA
eukprot:COSAG01_NODE_24315_length_783_cov_1.197368_1_plen_75_part_00